MNINSEQYFGGMYYAENWMFYELINYLDLLFSGCSISKMKKKVSVLLNIGCYFIQCWVSFYFFYDLVFV